VAKTAPVAAMTLVAAGLAIGNGTNAEPCDQFDTAKTAVSLWSWETRKPGEKREAVCRGSFRDRVRIRKAMNETSSYWKAYCSKETGFIARQLDTLKSRCLQYNPGRKAKAPQTFPKAKVPSVRTRQQPGTEWEGRPIQSEQQEATNSGRPTKPSKFHRDKKNLPWGLIWSLLVAGGMVGAVIWHNRQTKLNDELIAGMAEAENKTEHSPTPEPTPQRDVPIEERSTEDLQREAALRAIEDSERLRKKEKTDAIAGGFEAIGKLIWLGVAVFVLVFVIGPCVSLCATPA